MAQTPLANALSTLIDQVRSQIPKETAISTQRERNVLRKQGYVSRTLVQSVAAMLAAGKVQITTEVDPVATPEAVARVTAFWPLIDEIHAVGNLLEDWLLREAGAIGSAVSSTANAIVSLSKANPRHAALATARQGVVAARKKTDPLLPKQARKPRTPKVATPKTTRTTTTTTTTEAHAGNGRPATTPATIPAMDLLQK